jgi:hypothetical protein
MARNISDFGLQTNDGRKMFALAGASYAFSFAIIYKSLLAWNEQTALWVFFTPRGQGSSVRKVSQPKRFGPPAYTIYQ